VKFRLSLILAAIALLVPVALEAQRVSDPVYPLAGSGMIKVTPAQLGVNALTEPGSGTTAASSIIDLTGARAFTLKFSCTQGAITVNTTFYDETGAVAQNTVAPLSAVAANTIADLYVSTEQDIQATTGTLGAKIRLPQKAVSFTFTNASASAGTCTARMFISF